MRDLIDMHCDTIRELQKGPAEYTLTESHLCVDLDGMHHAGTMVQVFACFVNVKEHTGKQKTSLISADAWERAYQEALTLLERLKLEENDHIKMVHKFCEIQENRERNRISALASVEEGGVLNNKLERLFELYHAGIRLITLTWNYENCIGFPNSREEAVMIRGLKSFGCEVIETMDQLGMLIDVSHLSDGGFWDCIRMSNSPIVASHSNARALCRHPRNLTDEMLKALAEKGGVAGLNFYPVFLRENGVADLKDIARHAMHMINTAGEDVAAIGTDFDGFEADSREEYISHIGEMDRVWDCMKQQGITERQLDKIWSGNVLRVFQEILK